MVTKTNCEPIPTIALNDYPYSSAKNDPNFIDYFNKKQNDSHYNLCDYLKGKSEYIIVQKLQAGAPFSSSDVKNLEEFVNFMASTKYINCNQRINTFKHNPPRLDLPTIFNEIAAAFDYDTFRKNTKQSFTKGRGGQESVLPHFFSIVKHCQDPDSYPINYKQWVNLNEHCKWSISGNNVYDKLCYLYNNCGIPNTDTPKHVYFAAYMDKLARDLANALAPNITRYSPGNIESIFNTKYYDSIMGVTRGKNNKVILPATPPQPATTTIGTITTTPQSTTLDDPHHPLNLILYGPPGTGKTYNTLFHALAIIEGKKVKDIENECKEFDKLHNDDPKTNPDDGYKKIKENYHYDDLVKKGQIVFTTFHQSMSYEDFIEGIKPIPPRNNEEQMVYDVQDGLFKQICEKAKKISVVNTSTKIDFSKTRVFKMSLGEKGKDADSVFEYCVENEVLALGWGDSKDFSTCKTRADFKKLDPTWGAAALEIFKEWMKPGDIVLISDGTKEVKGVAQVDGDYEFRDDPSIDMHQFRKAKWLYTGDNIPISKLYDKNLSQQSIYGFYKEKKGVVDNGGIKIDVLNEIITGEINDKKEENYVLIIDEINRGNVAQIFGELITLIEPSKRLGNSEEMKAILPYSSAQKGNPVYFGVPNNLYIIGTMNTADRSVEALDTALRRRFSFEEMMPKPELLTKIQLTKGDPIVLKEVLEKINYRIIVLKDREHQIGHSYFMGHDDKNEDGSDKYQNKEEWLTNVFKDKIIPLLQEYFYGDYKKIYYVLGEGFVKLVNDKGKDDIFSVEIDDDIDIDQSMTRYEISIDKNNIEDAVFKLMVSNRLIGKYKKDKKFKYNNEEFSGEEALKKIIIDGIKEEALEEVQGQKQD